MVENVNFITAFVISEVKLALLHMFYEHSSSDVVVINLVLSFEEPSCDAVLSELCDDSDRTHARMDSRVTMHHKGVAAKSAGEVFH